MLKRTISLFIAILMLLSCVGCGTVGDDVTTDEPESSTDALTEEMQNEPYTGEFKVGYGRADVTPDESLLGRIPATDSSSPVFDKIVDPLYSTCIALSDGKNTAMLITIDTKHATDGFVDTVKRRVNAITKIKKDDIIVHVTHNHSSPNPSQSGDQYIAKWLAKLYTRTAEAAKDAIDDLSPAVAYTSKIDTKGYAFVRRYLHEDGGYSAIQNHVKNTTPIVAHETEVDADMPLIRFVREDKKDIVMANWQCHVAQAISVHPSGVTADFVHHIRNDVEFANDDVLFAYFQGASGNVNTTVKIRELAAKGAGNYKLIGKALADKLEPVLKSLDGWEKVDSGAVVSDKGTVEAVVNPVSEEDAAHAVEIQAANYDEELIKKYGFATEYDVRSFISRSRSGKSKNVPVSAIAFGDLAFVAVPYEMFHESGSQVKEGSPYKTTFMLTCSNGHYGYIPTEFAFPHKGYEVNVCLFVQGTAEQFVAKYIEMLTQMKNK